MPEPAQSDRVVITKTATAGRFNVFLPGGDAKYDLTVPQVGEAIAPYGWDLSSIRVRLEHAHDA